MDKRHILKATREIKFRGKRLDNGKWAIGDLRHRNDGSLAIITNLNVWSDNNGKVDAYGEEFEVDPETVGQFTGLEDKNGKDVYEGDILGSEGRVIGWVKGGVRGYCYDVVYINHPAGESDWPLYSTVKYDYPEQIEVIGNIHDNPDLLKGGNE